MVVVEVVVFLTGGAPWGFRLQGGAEHHKPLQVAKVRRRSKACRAGLKVDDELVAIEDHKCEELSHCAAMNLIDTQRTTLSLRVKRASTAVHSSSRSTSPRCSAKLRSPPDASSSSPPHRSSLLHRPRCITSPPDSEAYYGETDSDVDTQTHTHRRQRRTPPHARAPGRYDNQQEETSEMSGYESAPDGGLFLQGQGKEGVGLGEGLPGVPRRELVYQSDWTPPAHTPQTLTPHTLTPTLDQGLVEGEGEEGDSGFQEAGCCAGMTCPPLVSPERAKGALMLGSGRQLVPMVGPQKTPLSDELAATYKDKARQAKLQRGESVVEKQVKEARTKCRSIASLLTDAPNPNSKGVLMFKKRRQRAKKYTLTCFGKAAGDAGAETGGETGGETEEEGGSSNLSGSEVDEEGFSASFDATWDSGYLDVLDRKSSACPASTPTTPVANHRAGLDLSTYHSQGCMASVAQSPGLDFFRVDGSACQGSNATQPVIAGLSPAHSPGQISPPVTALTNGGSVAVSRASVVLSPPPNPSPNPNPNPGLNRTARPFTPGSAQSRLSVAPVLFHPSQPKPTGVTPVTISAPHQSSMPEARRAVSSASLYLSPRSANGSCPLSPPPTASFPQPPSAPCAPQAPFSSNPAPFSLSHAPLSHNHTHVSSNHAPFPPPPTPFSPLSAPFSPNSAPFSHNPTPFSNSAPFAPNSASFSPNSAPFSPNSAPFSPPVAAQGPPVYPSPAPPFSPPTPQSFHSYLSAPTSAAPQLHTPSQVYIQSQAPPPSAPAFTSVANATATASPTSCEQRIAVPAARTGILQDACRHSGGKKKPMFATVQNREVSPNPALLSMLQSIDHPTETVPGPGPISAVMMMTGPGAEAGHESGPEDDWLRLGAEACNFLQSQQRGSRPPPVAPKPQLAGRGGELFARRQSRMDRYVVERSPSVAPSLCFPGQMRQASPTPSLPATWKYSPNIRAPPPISYNPLLSPSCPPRAQKPQKAEPARPIAGLKRGQKGSIKAVDIMAHQPYQLNASLFTYGGGAPQGSSLYQQQQMPTSTARVYEVKRFSTPPPTATGPALKVIAPRSATTLGEPLWRSDVDAFPLTTPASPPYRPQWTSTPLSPPPPPAPTAPLPLLPSFTPSAAAAAHPLPPMPTFSHLQPPNAGANRQFKSFPDLSPPGVVGGPQSALLTQVPRPRFSTSNLGLQPSIWRPGSNGH